MAQPPSPAASASASGDDSDETRHVDRLAVVEYLRKTHRIHGALAEFTVDEAECSVTFKGPGYSADARIARETGEYSLTQRSQGFVAVINDLHKGRDTGRAWAWLIDVSAALMTLVSLSGLILLFYLKRRRLAGVAIALIGTAVVAAVYYLWVP